MPASTRRHPHHGSLCHHRWRGFLATHATFVHEKRDWLKQWLDLPNGVPSHDTFERVFRKLDVSAFERRFSQWTSAVFQVTVGQVVAVDGKTLRGSRAQGVRSGLHLVSAWATHNGISLGQCRVDGKTNEITVIPELLALLALKGCIVTLDAMGCQTAIAEQIVSQQADYVFTVKGNQKTLHGYLEGRFASADDVRFRHRLGVPDQVETLDVGHGRQEWRLCEVLRDEELVKWGWVGCQSIIRLTSERETATGISYETRYFISSLAPQASELLGCIRSHLGIENSLHWVLDVVFKEDANQTREAAKAENLSVLRRMALNLLKRHPDKRSVAQKRFAAALNTSFLEAILKA